MPEGVTPPLPEQRRELGWLLVLRSLQRQLLLQLVVVDEKKYCQNQRQEATPKANVVVPGIIGAGAAAARC